MTGDTHNAKVRPDPHGATSSVPSGARPKSTHQQTSHSARKEKRTALSIRQMLHLLHRVGILVAAVLYFAICINATVATFQLLQDRPNPVTTSPPNRQYLMPGYIGTTTLRESPLVMTALQGDTSPRNGTLYLESAGPSYSICAGILARQRQIYTDTFLRSMYDAVVRDTKYSLTFMAENETELIMPVVDCVSAAIINAFRPLGKFNFLVRSMQDPDDVSIVTVQLANQEYHITSQNERGPAGVATLTHLNDMRASLVEHHYIVSIGYPYAEFAFRVYNFLNVTTEGMWCLETIPDASRGDIAKVMITAFRSGFYIKSETEQFNINNEINIMSNNPVTVITEWSSSNKATVHDSWGWVHGIQLFLGIDLLLNLVVLLLVIYRNMQAGKIWIGDAFVSVSTKILLRGALVLLSWYLNGFWAVFEFCVRDAYKVFGIGTTLKIYDAIMQADLLCIYLSFCGILGVVLRARVDPLLAVLCFMIGYELRDQLIHMFPATAKAVALYAYYTFTDGVPARMEGQEFVSPMGYWTSHLLNNRTATFVCQQLLPVFSTLVLVVAYIICCKIFRFFVPEKLHIIRSSNNTGASGGEDALLVQKRVLTLFEIATGAELASRFGLMSSYENYLFIKGMKFASADGIYSNGFVIANDKYLVQTDDFWKIVAMKMIRRRYANIYVYEITGSTVQQTAKLVYPHTFSVRDLMNLNISVLS